jgi:hypothetical protein
VWRVYGKEIECLFYCSYHAYGRADGAGAQDNVQAVRDFRSGLLRLGAASYTEMTNAIPDPGSWAFHFPSINRSNGLFPDGTEFKTRVPFLRKWCEIKYEYEGRDESTVGIVLYRLVSAADKAPSFGGTCWRPPALPAKSCVQDVLQTCNVLCTTHQRTAPTCDNCTHFPSCVMFSSTRIESRGTETSAGRNRRTTK